MPLLVCASLILFGDIIATLVMEATIPQWPNGARLILNWYDSKTNTILAPTGQTLIHHHLFPTLLITLATLVGPRFAGRWWGLPFFDTLPRSSARKLHCLSTNVLSYRPAPHAANLWFHRAIMCSARHLHGTWPKCLIVLCALRLPR